jgi:UDP-GlcNAc:undecaprenyl-phosphate/decaprenyl-phosphate GlcNAc-1-phosphate transferase
MNYILLFIASYAILIFYIYFAEKVKIVDKPSSRSSHHQLTVRGGGIIFPIIALWWFLWSDFQHPIFFLGLTILSIVSFCDDLFQLNNSIRFIAQLVSVILLCLEIGIGLYPYWIWIIVVIIAVGILNAYNFMDGINGITAGYSISVLTGLWVVNNFQVEFISNEFIYSTAISLLVFSLFNFRSKAKCFAGDVGSISIAFILVFMLALLIVKTNNPLYLLFLSIYGIDSILTIIYRIWLKENIFKPHRKHVYQLLANELRIAHPIVSIIYSFIQLSICFIVYFSIKRSIIISQSLTLGLCMLSLLILLFITARININRRFAHKYYW